MHTFLELEFKDNLGQVIHLMNQFQNMNLFQKFT